MIIPQRYSYIQRRLVDLTIWGCSFLHCALQALAQDQRAALEQLLWACPGLEHIKVATYDGDTPQELRAGGLYIPPGTQLLTGLQAYARTRPSSLQILI